MTTIVAMPKLGLLMTQGLVIEWLVADGAWVEKNEPIVEIITEKITYQVVAPAAGILYHVARVDELVLLGDPLAAITDRDEPSPARQTPHLAQRRSLHAATADAAVAAVGPNDRFVLASPWARHLARKLEVDLGRLRGTGPDGSVVGRDVLKSLDDRRRSTARQRPPLASSRARSATPSQTMPFSGMRKVIAQRMTESLHTMAQATLTAEADVTDLAKLLGEHSESAGVTHVDLVIKAVATALKDHPRLNVVLFDDEIELLEEVHVGLAVPLQEGLLVPVIRNADKLTPREIAAEAHRLTQRARDGALSVDDVTGSTFTVTDLGAYGIDFFVPIINPPEAAILGIGRITEKPVVFRGEVVVRSMMMLCLTFDHRVVDGAPAAVFLEAVSDLLAEPNKLLA